jgi:hypothetical protein
MYGIHSFIHEFKRIHTWIKLIHTWIEQNVCIPQPTSPHSLLPSSSAMTGQGTRFHGLVLNDNIKSKEITIWINLMDSWYEIDLIGITVPIWNRCMKKYVELILLIDMCFNSKSQTAACQCSDHSARELVPSHRRLFACQGHSFLLKHYGRRGNLVYFWQTLKTFLTVFKSTPVYCSMYKKSRTVRILFNPPHFNFLLVQHQVSLQGVNVVY